MAEAAPSPVPTPPPEPAESGGSPDERPGFVVETHSIDYVPPEIRHGKARDLAFLWFGANCMVVTISTGVVAMTAGLGMTWTVVAVVVGLLIGAVFMAYHSAQGPKLGLPQMIQSRAQFGFYGANLPLVLVVLMYLGFFASGGVLGGQAVAELTGMPLWAGILVVSAGNVTLVLFGYRVIHGFERVLTVACVIVFGLFTVALATAAPPATQPAPVAHGFAPGPFLFVIATSGIYLLSYAPYVADYSRYLPQRTGTAPTFWYTYAGVVISGAWMIVLGAVLQTRYGDLSVVGQIAHVAGVWGPAFRIVVLLVVALGIVGINGLNIYGGFMSTLTIVTSYARRWRPTLALRVWFIVPVGLVGTALAELERDHFLDSYEAFLSFLLYFLAPWTAVNLTDYYLVRRGHYRIAELFAPRGMYGRVQSGGMVAYLLGCVVQVPFVNVDFYEGPVARLMGGGDIAWLVGILVSGGAYLWLMRGRREGATVPR